MVSMERDIPWKIEVCSRDIKDIRDGGVYNDSYTYGYQSKEY
jgi:hypothetical protein